MDLVHSAICQTTEQSGHALDDVPEDAFFMNLVENSGFAVTLSNFYFGDPWLIGSTSLESADIRKLLGWERSSSIIHFDLNKPNIQKWYDAIIRTRH